MTYLFWKLSDLSEQIMPAFEPKHDIYEVNYK